MKIGHKRLLKLAAFLDGLPSAKFDIREYVAENSAPDPRCGAVCCAVGWMPRVFPASWRWVDMGWANRQLSVQRRRNTTEDCWDDAASFFNIGVTVMDAMFKDTAYPMAEYGGRKVTPKVVAARVRKTVARLQKEKP